MAKINRKIFEIKKELILKEASLIFEESGYENMKISDLAKNVVPVYAGGSRGSKKAPKVSAPTSNYTPGINSAPQTVSASWDDEDIVDPNINPDLNRQISTPQVVAPLVAPQVQIPEPPAAQTYNEKPSIPQAPSAPVWEPTQAAPPQTPAPVVPTPPTPTQAPSFDSPVIGSPSYVPSFKKASHEDVAPADKIDDALNQPNKFLDDYAKDNENNTDDGQNKFWSP